jgi:hypothetical protein
LGHPLRAILDLPSLVLALWFVVAPFTWSDPPGSFASAQDKFAQNKPCRAAYVHVTEGITVVESRASHSFAQQITFTLQATSDAEIDRVYLSFRAINGERTETLPMDVEPAREIDVNYVHDLRGSSLPPFAAVVFWWHIEDAAGHSLTTDHYQFEYTDNRFQWEELSGPGPGPGNEGLTVHWIEGHGDLIFGQAALDVASISVAEVNAELHAPRPESIDVYVYDAEHNLDAAIALTGRKWVGGQAHPELGVVVVAIPYQDGYTSRMKRYIPHEITHLLVYQAVTPDGYRYVPEWLDEGLATANERLPTVEYTMALDDARAQGQLLPLEDLCVPFPPDFQTALLSYAQSGSVVQFIREQYGAKGVRDLLAAYRDGASCTVGIQEALNVSLRDLETEWQASLEPQAPWRALVKPVGVWVGLWLLSLLVAVPMIGRFHPRR